MQSVVQRVERGVGGGGWWVREREREKEKGNASKAIDINCPPVV